ncbi:MAG: F0F1 ATP synthase subunit B [Chloroflexota bacterium]|nr:F0F1 ATP synthase subunit B [Chloroflexota bacterium]
MNQSKMLKRLLLVLALVVGMAFASIAAAQEATTEAPVAEGGAAEGGGEGEAVAEGEEAAVNPLTPLGINTGFLIAQIVNFLALFGLLTFVIWRPLVNMLDSRAAKIQKGLEDAAAAANARRNAEVEAEKIRNEARADVQRMIEEARQRADEVGKNVEAEARTEAEKIRADSRGAATVERDRQLGELRSQVAAIAIAAAQRLIGENLDQQRQQVLINDFFAKVPADARALSGSVTVISAMPLSDEEKARVQAETGATDVNYTVDPAILGGLIIQAQDRVVDGSIRNNLNAMAGRLR